MLVNRMFVIDNITRSGGRQVDRSTSRQFKIYKWICRYSPSGNTRTKCMMGKRAYVVDIAVNTYNNHHIPEA